MENGLEKIENKLTADLNIYRNVSELKVTEDEQKKLLASFDAKEIEIRPDGLIYLPQTFWRKRLNEAFGIGQWALVPKSSTKDPDRDRLYLEGVLMVRGTYVATAVGEAEYHSDNAMQSWASVYESAKSDCITRCCKDLSIASELWQPEFIRNWIATNAVKVFIEKKGGGKGISWRKKTSPKYWNETGIVPDGEPAAPSPSTNGKITPNQNVQAEDNRTWLNDNQYEQAQKRIKEGDRELYPKLKAEYKMKKVWREVLEKLHEAPVPEQPETPAAIVFTEAIKRELLAQDSLSGLNAVYFSYKGLHENKEFLSIYLQCKTKIATPEKKQREKEPWS